MVKPPLTNSVRVFSRFKLFLLIFFIVHIAQPVTCELEYSTPVPTPVKHHATGKQREQLLQLKSIVTSALKSSSTSRINGSTESAIGSASPIETKSRGKTTSKPKYWWISKPFFIASISAGCVSLVVLVLLCIVCTPLCNSVDCPCRKGFSSGGKADLGDGSSDGGSLCQEAAIADCPSPYGVIRYLMTYNQDTEELTVLVKGCTDLPRNISGTLNPYILVRIVSKDGAGAALSETEAIATPVERGTTSPEFNYPCSFKLAKADLTKAAVKFEVYDRDEVSKEPALLARCRHNLEDRRYGNEIDDLLLNTATDEKHVFRRRLKRGLAADCGPGEICVLLRRGGADEAPLMVRVIECKGVHLKQSDGQLDKHNLPNTYVELMLMEPNGPIHVKRSDTVDKSRNPYFNEEFSFPAMPADRLRHCALRFSLVHVSDFLRSKQAVGSVELSADDDGASGESDRRFRLAREHWLSITESKAQQQQQAVSKCCWHSLVAPDEEMHLRRARAMNAARK
uniref:C2 domain-containing protein n=1 Tax=Macrostomum lignano TaxID=282301 RepID=A0A1I8HLV2_9PLAT